MLFDDTIAAVATAMGQGGIAIIRISGPEAEAILQKVFRPAGKKYPLPSHLMAYGHLMDGDTVVDEAMAVVMRAPRSYTREDVCEIHVHGGRVVATDALNLALHNGARSAEPGEFTRRAFLNGRIDLSQAEAVMGMIQAGSHQAARAAVRQLEGGVSKFIRDAQGELSRLLSGLEAAIDYPDEVEESEASQGLLTGLKSLADTLDGAVNEKSARVLDTGLEVTLCGCPNVGKSSLLNALLGEEKAIVTPIPGTTRDVLTGAMELDGIRVNLKDTAGLHEAQDEVEKIGIDRAQKAMQSADLVLLVLDGSRALNEEDKRLLADKPDSPRLVLLNKADLPQQITKSDVLALCPEESVLPLSAASGRGMAELKKAIRAQAGNADQAVLTYTRHMEAARKAAACLRAGADTLLSGAPMDLAAIDLHTAMDALCQITGDNPTETLLDDVFSRFCVGK